MKQKRFTKEFEEEAVRLMRTSERTKREIADDLGVGLSTLTRWLSRSRDREMDEPARRAPGEDMAAELKRLGSLEGSLLKLRTALPADQVHARACRPSRCQSSVPVASGRSRCARL